jgi:hypothetical protein
LQRALPRSPSTPSLSDDRNHHPPVTGSARHQQSALSFQFAFWIDGKVEVLLAAWEEDGAIEIRHLK